MFRHGASSALSSLSRLTFLRQSSREMEALSAHAMAAAVVGCSFQFPTPRNDLAVGALPSKLSSQKVKCCEVWRRRLLLHSVALGASALYVHSALPVTLPEKKEPDIIRSLKLPSGVRIQDIVDGEGAEAREGDLVKFNYVCRRANGYFVHSTVDQFSGESEPVILHLNEKQMILGLKEVLVGMKVGGKRRALIPPEVGYVNENLKPIPTEFGPRRSLLSHANEPLIFEVQLLKVL